MVYLGAPAPALVMPGRGQGVVYTTDTDSVYNLNILNSNFCRDEGNFDVYVK